MTENEILLGYLSMTDKVSKSSKDPSTKVGALFLNKNNTPISFGYNGMPRGLDDNNEVRNQRPEKYLWYEHAERNAIYNVAREILEGHMMFSTHYFNMESARAVVSSGIKKVVILDDSGIKILTDEETKMRERVKQLLSETGVELMLIDKSVIEAGFSPYDINEFKDQSINNVDKEKVLLDKLNEFNKKEKYLGYLEIVQDYANTFSPDLTEKSGCMILNEKTLAPIENGFGVNAPPSTFKEITEEMHQNKSSWFIEAEKNAILNAVKVKFEGTTAVASWCPCTHCQLAMAALDLEKVVTRKIDFTNEADLRWKESFEISQRICELSGTELVLLDLPKPTPYIVDKKKKNKLK